MKGQSLPLNLSVVMAILVKLKQYVNHKGSLLPLRREESALGGHKWLPREGTCSVRSSGQRGGSGGSFVEFVFLATVE